MSDPGADARFVPTPDGPNVGFYARASATGRLHLQRCGACGRWQHPPRYRCPACGGEPGWERASGRGRIHSWTTTHRPVDPAWPVPYTTVVVETDEGPKLVGAWEDDASPELDQPVEVGIEPAGDEFAFLWFSPTRS